MRKVTYKNIAKILVIMLCFFNLITNCIVNNIDAEENNIELKTYVYLGGYGIPFSESSDESPAFTNFNKATFYYAGFWGSGLDPQEEFYWVGVRLMRKDMSDGKPKDTVSRSWVWRKINKDLINEDGTIADVWATLGAWQLSPGEYYYQIRLEDSNENLVYSYSDRDNISTTIRSYGFSSQAVLNDKYYAGTYNRADVDLSDGSKNVKITNRINAILQNKNSDYTLRQYIYEKDGTQISDSKLVYGPYDQIITTDDIGKYSDKAIIYEGDYEDIGLELNKEYVIYAELINSSDSIDYKSDVIDENTKYFTNLRYSFILLDKSTIPEDSDSTIKWTMSKKDIETNEVLENAKMKLVKGSSEDGEVVHSWTTTSEAMEPIDLHPGTYTLIEEEAPNGYIKGNSETFKLKESDAYISETHHQSYHVSSDEDDAIYIYPANDKEEDIRIGYCFNRHKSYPQLNNGYVTGETLIYTEYFGNEENIEKYVDRTNVDSEQLKNILAKILYIGYPNNAKVFSVIDENQNESMLSLQEKYNLTDKEISRVCQYAVWHYTDNESYSEGSFSNPQAYEAYLELTNEELNIELPENYRLYLYVPNNQNYQTVVGFKMASEIYEYTYFNKKGTNIEINKIDEKGNNVLGATLTLYNSNREEIASWETDGNIKSFLLPEGEYDLEETVTPKGYLTAMNILFKIDENRDLYVFENDGWIKKDSLRLEMIDINETIDITIKKIWDDNDNVDNLRPDKVEVVLYGDYGDNNKSVVDTFVLEKDNNYELTLIDLPKYHNGNEIIYTLEEINIPEGYTSQIDGYTITNKYVPLEKEEEKEFEIKLFKQNVFGYYIHGSIININEGDTEIDTYITDEEYTIKLKPGVYQFIETEAPFGFKIVDPITFEVSEEGKLNIIEGEKDAFISEDNILNVIDERDLLGAKQAFINKIDEEGNNLSGAKFIVVDENNNVHDEWISTETPHSIELLEGIYTIKELEAPSGYLKINDFKLEIDEYGNISIIDENNNTLSVTNNSLFITNKKEVKEEVPPIEEEPIIEEPIVEEPVVTEPVIIPDDNKPIVRTIIEKPKVVNTATK